MAKLVLPHGPLVDLCFSLSSCVKAKRVRKNSKTAYGANVSGFAVLKYYLNPSQCIIYLIFHSQIHAHVKHFECRISI